MMVSFILQGRSYRDYNFVKSSISRRGFTIIAPIIKGEGG